MTQIKPPPKKSGRFTFPASVVDKPKAKVVKVQIGENINGCLTKFKKNRTIEIPASVMDLLYEYKLSKARKKAIEKGLLRHNHLFVKSNGNIYAPNTIQKYVETIRNDLTHCGLDIYFAPHDLRATCIFRPDLNTYSGNT
ncbi:site-specific integrase [Klebsiella pneumoniae]|uniref:site-specific integrase n=1 Tax=Klebsiella pneumoniae TaxID=573 RepID=UPI0024802B43|nr:site-specific integrase [Klebsiella pneumoniae]